MATPVDLSWADEDELWAREGLYLADETYKLMYDCLHLDLSDHNKLQYLLLRFQSSHARCPLRMRSTFHLVLQVPSGDVIRSPPGPDHVKNTRPLGSHTRDLPRVGCKVNTPCLIFPLGSGVSHLLHVLCSSPKNKPAVNQSILPSA
jgi:hypothetical protein